MGEQSRAGPSSAGQHAVVFALLDSPVCIWAVPGLHRRRLCRSGCKAYRLAYWGHLSWQTAAQQPPPVGLELPLLSHSPMAAVMGLQPPKGSLPRPFTRIRCIGSASDPPLSISLVLNVGLLGPSPEAAESPHTLVLEKDQGACPWRSVDSLPSGLSTLLLRGPPTALAIQDPPNVYQSLGRLGRPLL